MERKSMGRRGAACAGIVDGSKDGWLTASGAIVAKAGEDTTVGIRVGALMLLIE